MLKQQKLSLKKLAQKLKLNNLIFAVSEDGIFRPLFFGPFRGGKKPPVLPGEEKGFSKVKNGELKAAEVVANN